MQLGPSQGERHPLWSKETLLSDVKSHGSVRKVCRIYGGADGWQRYYSDIFRWNRSDPSFRKRLLALVKRRGGGRPRLDGGDKSWFDQFFEALYRRGLNEYAAAQESGCPYSPRQLREFRSRSSSSFDKDYWERYEDVRIRIANEAKEEAVKTMRPVEVPDKYDEDAVELAVTKAKIQQMRSQTLTRVLQSVDREEFGRELHLKGQIDHRHQLESRYRDPNEVIAELAGSYREFQRSRMAKQLESGDRNVIDVEVVPEKSSAGGDDPA